MFHTVSQVADRLGVSASCIYQLIESGQLVPHRLGPNRGAIRISERDLLAYIESCRDAKDHKKQEKRRPARTTLKHLKLS
ncbi:MAG: helix-turn-helix domain-containing protein [Planctomycetaceae bacterium]